MKTTEVMRVLAAVDGDGGLSTEELATKTGLGFSAVRLILDELERAPVLYEEDGQWAVTRIGDEILMTRGSSATVAETPGAEA